MDKKRSLIAILLSLTITLTFMPVMAFADDVDPDDQSETVGILDSETLNAETQDTDASKNETAEDEETPAERAAVDDEMSAMQDVSYNIYIGGKRVRESNKDDVLGDGSGSVKYDPSTNTITLTNATIEMKRRESADDGIEWGIRFNKEGSEDYSNPLNIVLIGDNKIVDNDTETGTIAKYGIEVYGVVPQISFTGSGALSVIGSRNTPLYRGIEVRKNTIIDGPSISIDMEGDDSIIDGRVSAGLYLVYGYKLTLRNNAKISINIKNNSDAFGNSESNNDDLIVEAGSFLAISKGRALSENIRLSDSTKAQGVWVSTEADPKGCTLWDGTSKLSNYKFIHIPKDHDCMWDEGVLTRPATETEEGIMTFTCKICGKTKTEAIPKLAPKLKVFAAKAVAKGKRAVKISWNKADGAERYVIYGARCGKKLKKIKTVKASKQSYTKKSLKARKNYKFRVVAQKMVDGKWTTIAKANTAHVIVGGSNKKYTNPKSLKVKPAKMTLSVGSSKSVKTVIRKVKGGKALLKHAKRLRYTSSNPAVATVSAKGKVEAVGTGSCTIYVQTVNGIWKTVSVTVN